jgi:hypothetical protein
MKYDTYPSFSMGPQVPILIMLCLDKSYGEIAGVPARRCPWRLP